MTDSELGSENRNIKAPLMSSMSFMRVRQLCRVSLAQSHMTSLVKWCPSEFVSKGHGRQGGDGRVIQRDNGPCKTGEAEETTSSGKFLCKCRHERRGRRGAAAGPQGPRCVLWLKAWTREQAEQGLAHLLKWCCLCAIFLGYRVCVENAV
ncbi:hypothetical protein MHYP_G00110480 [Metynnis hypsauchen]